MSKIGEEVEFKDLKIKDNHRSNRIVKIVIIMMINLIIFLELR